MTSPAQKKEGQPQQGGQAPAERPQLRVVKPVRRMTQKEWDGPSFPMSLARAALDAIPAQYVEGVLSGTYSPKSKGDSAEEELYPSEAAERARRDSN